MSAAEGVYMAPNKAALLNVPEPEVDHVEETALPPITPAKVYVPPEQIVALLPAAAVAAGLMVITIVLVTNGHGPAGSLVVNVKVTVPAAMSAPEGVYTAVADVAKLNVPVPEVDHNNVVALPPIEPANV